MRRVRRWALAFVAMGGAAWVVGCQQPAPGPSAPAAELARALAAPLQVASGESASTAPTEKPGLRFTVKEVESVEAPATAAVSVLQAALASGDAVGAVIDRLPVLEERSTDRVPFALRPESPPPPVTGARLSMGSAKGAAPAPLAKPSGPLEVVRFAPDGKVELAPHVRLTFSEPMVPLASLAELDRKSVPARMEPELPGTWQWLGTRTLLFQPTAKRLPMATRFTVTVPAGTRSQNGATSEKDFVIRFETPAPQLRASLPRGSGRPRDPVVALRFDQRVDPAAVLRVLSVRVQGESAERAGPALVPVASDSDDFRKARGRFGKVDAESVVAFRFAAKLPGLARVEVRVPAGTPSAEGPVRTAAPQSCRFKTYGPLEVRRHGGLWGRRGEPIRPYTPLFIELTNSLDVSAFDEEAVRIAPKIPGVKVAVGGRRITIRGATKGRTTYTVTVPATLTDRYGQTLGTDTPLTFKIGKTRPRLFSDIEGNYAILDPHGAPALRVYTINQPSFNLEVRRVYPADWTAFAESGRRDRSIPGQLVMRKTISVDGRPEELAETRIDLADAFGKDGAHLVVEVKEQGGFFSSKKRLQSFRVWLERTPFGVDTYADRGQLVVMCSRLRDGAPVAGATVRILPDGIEAKTDADGTARLELQSVDRRRRSPVLLVRKGKTETAFPASEYSWNTNAWRARPAARQVRWYVASDRGLYRPGETARVKGWVRLRTPGPKGDLSSARSKIARISYQLRGARGNELAKGDASVNPMGGFDLTLEIPLTANLGFAHLQLNTSVKGGGAGSGHGMSLRIQEFRRPEFEVTLDTSGGPHLVGGRARAEVSARYFSGGPLGGAKVSWRVTASPGRYVPPGRSDFTFGRYVPWWEPTPGRWANRRTQLRSSRTDSRGKAAIALALEAATPPRAHTLEIEATVFDVNRQPFAAKKTLVVHPSARYIGVRADRTFVQEGQPMRFEAIVSDLDGNLQAKAPIDLQVVRLDWEQKAGKWTRTEREVARARLESAAKAVAWAFTAKEGGSFRLVARTVDDRDRPNETVLRFWVAGGERPPSRKLTEEKLTLIPERETVRPGEAIQLLVQSPFFPAEGIATLEREGIASVKRFRMTGPSYTLSLPVGETALPNIWVRVDLVGAAKRADAASDAAPLRPAFAHAQLNVKVSTEARKLAVEVKPRDAELEPGAKTTVQLSVRDAKGAPVAGAEVCLVVVDEAVLSLLGYRLPDPLGVFYPSRSSGVSARRSRSHVVLARPEELLAHGAAQPPPMASPAPGSALKALSGARRRANGGLMEAAVTTDGAAPGAETRSTAAGGSAIKLRKDLRALAGFFPAIRTATDGTASVEVTLPDSLTRYRLMAVATGGAKRYGHAEATVVARRPLMVRPAFPRFLRFGDRCELGVLVQNQTDRPLEALALLNATNLTVEDQDGPVGKKVTVPARGRVEVRFRVAAEQAGTARVQVAAVAGRFADAQIKEIPVWTPATAEAFATYGQLDTDDPVAYQVVTPLDAVPEHGGLEVSVATTQLQALTDAVLYLAKYPFGCSEQLASRIISVVALRDVLGAFHAEGLPQKAALVAAMERDLKTLAGRQDYSGGFGLWRKGGRVWPYASVHAAHALVRAKAKGYEVSKRVLSRARNYLRRIRRYIPKVYGRRARISIEAYALYVRALMNDRDPDAARRLVREVGSDKLPVEAAGWLLTVLGAGRDADALWRVIQNRVEETADAAQVTTAAYGKEGYLLFASDRRADAAVLEALVRTRPGSDLIPKLVRGLLKHRKKGRWASTQENAFCLLALYEYFRRFEKAEPDLVARVWLGEASAGEQVFKGRQTETRTVRVPMAFLKKGQTTRELLLQRKGKGRLYYRVGLRYAPATLELPPVERGFTVTRRYLAIDDPADVRRDEKGVWHVKAGARVRVELTMVAPARRYHVALVDPLPAGLEAVTPGLLGSRTAPPAKDHQKRWGWWTWRWFEHQNLRDDRAEAFSSLLWEGVYRYRYVAQATTIGRFVASPPKAEEMYSPETFGRGRTDIVIVE